MSGEFLMEQKLIELLKNRRSIYALGKNVTESKEEIVKLVKKCYQRVTHSF